MRGVGRGAPSCAVRRAVRGSVLCAQNMVAHLSVLSANIMTFSAAPAGRCFSRISVCTVPLVPCVVPLVPCVHAHAKGTRVSGSAAGSGGQNMCRQPHIPTLVYTGCAGGSDAGVHIQNFQADLVGSGGGGGNALWHFVGGMVRVKGHTPGTGIKDTPHTPTRPHTHPSIRTNRNTHERKHEAGKRRAKRQGPGSGTFSRRNTIPCSLWRC